MPAELSDDEESQSAASEMGHQDLFDEDAPGQEVDLMVRELTEEGPASDHSDDL